MGHDSRSLHFEILRHRPDLVPVQEGFRPGYRREELADLRGDIAAPSLACQFQPQAPFYDGITLRQFQEQLRKPDSPQ